MSGDFNQHIIIGNVGRDPEIRYTGSGDPIANLSIATNRFWKKDGERVQETSWHRVVVFDPRLAKLVEDYVKKGDKIRAVGYVNTRNYEKDGETKYITETVVPRFNGDIGLMGGKSDNNGAGGGGGGSKDDTTRPATDNTAPGADPFDDDIPF